MRNEKNITTYSRLRDCILADKQASLPKEVLEVLRRDLTELLSQYFEIRTVAADLDYDKTGKLWLTIDSLVTRVKPFEKIASV